MDIHYREFVTFSRASINVTALEQCTTGNHSIAECSFSTLLSPFSMIYHNDHNTRVRIHARGSGTQRSRLCVRTVSYDLEMPTASGMRVCVQRASHRAAVRTHMTICMTSCETHSALRRCGTITCAAQWSHQAVPGHGDARLVCGYTRMGCNCKHQLPSYLIDSGLFILKPALTASTNALARRQSSSKFGEIHKAVVFLHWLVTVFGRAGERWPSV